MVQLRFDANQVAETTASGPTDVTRFGDATKNVGTFFLITDRRPHMAYRRFRTGAFAALTLLLLHVAVHAQEADPSARQKLVVVELFQSQGCSSCPPAEANLNAVADQPGVLALSFAVTYWDDLGWKDTFATSAYTERQWNYAHYHRRDTVWTPQMYVNGHADLVGTDRAQLQVAIAQAQSHGPSIEWAGNSVIIKADSSSNGASDVWLVRYDPRTQEVAIGGGENGGRTLAQRNVVREFSHLGTWDGRDKAFAIPALSASGLKTAALVQVQEGGDILSASVQDSR
jgi:hypothetical protein